MAPLLDLPTPPPSPSLLECSDVMWNCQTSGAPHVGGGRAGVEEQRGGEGLRAYEEENAHGCNVHLRTPPPSPGGNSSSGIAARLPPRAKLPITAVVCRLFVTPLMSPPLPQVSEGLAADASLLDDSDLEARLNRWNLGVSLRARHRRHLWLQGSAAS